MSDPIRELEARIAAAQAKRKAIADSEKLPYLEQRAADMETLAELEAEHGSDRVLRIDLKGWTPGKGAATMVVVRLPLSSESVFRRFRTKVSKRELKPHEGVEAEEELARACMVYPHPKNARELYEATIDIGPGLLAHAATEIVRWAQGKAAEEKN